MNQIPQWRQLLCEPDLEKQFCLWCEDPDSPYQWGSGIICEREVVDRNGSHIELVWFHHRCVLQMMQELFTIKSVAENFK